MWSAILGYVIKLLPIIPQLVTTIENLWAPKPKAGAQKWISVEQALSGSIADVAQTVASIAPMGTKPEQVSAAIAVFSKAVNDAFVALANDLQLFAHGGKAGMNSLPSPPIPEK